MSATDPDYFGACPDCGGNDGLIHIGPECFGHCKTHRRKWYLGSNPYGEGWRQQTVEENEDNARYLADFTEDVMYGDVYECGWKLSQIPVDDWPDDVVRELAPLRRALAEGPLRLSDQTTKEQAAILVALLEMGTIRIIPGNPTVAEAL